MGVSKNFGCFIYFIICILFYSNRRKFRSNIQSRAPVATPRKITPQQTGQSLTVSGRLPKAPEGGRQLAQRTVCSTRHKQCNTCRTQDDSCLRKRSKRRTVVLRQKEQRLLPSKARSSLQRRAQLPRRMSRRRWRQLQQGKRR